MAKTGTKHRLLRLAVPVPHKVHQLDDPVIIFEGVELYPTHQ
jgi:hypothetical protein